MLRTFAFVIPWTLSLALADFDRQAAVLDLSSRIGEGASGLLSMTQSMTVAGIPFDSLRETAETADPEYNLPIESMEASQMFFQVHAVYR
jgi:hypothetical protein